MVPAGHGIGGESRGRESRWGRFHRFLCNAWLTTLFTVGRNKGSADSDADAGDNVEACLKRAQSLIVILILFVAAFLKCFNSFGNQTKQLKLFVY